MQALAAAAGLALAAGTLRAHDGGHLELRRLDARLERAPDDLDARLARALAHRAHGDLQAALADLARARALAPQAPRLDWVRACIDAELGFRARALEAVDRWLAAEPGHVDGRVLRARLRAAEGRLAGALADYDRVLAAAPVPRPTWFVERARVRRRLGGDATPGLLAGLARYGTHPELLEAAFEDALADGAPERAAAHLAVLERGFPGRADRWRRSRAELASARADAAREPPADAGLTRDAAPAEPHDPTDAGAAPRTAPEPRSPVPARGDPP